MADQFADIAKLERRAWAKFAANRFSPELKDAWEYALARMQGLRAQIEAQAAETPPSDEEMANE